MTNPEAYLVQWHDDKKDWTNAQSYTCMHSGIQKFKYGCHRHSSVDTTSTPKLQLFLFALPVCASEWESTKQNMCPNQKYIYSIPNVDQIKSSFIYIAVDVPITFCCSRSDSDHLILTICRYRFFPIRSLCNALREKKGKKHSSCRLRLFFNLNDSTQLPILSNMDIAYFFHSSIGSVQLCIIGSKLNKAYTPQNNHVNKLSADSAVTKQK